VEQLHEARHTALETKVRDLDRRIGQHPS